MMSSLRALRSFIHTPPPSVFSPFSSIELPSAMVRSRSVSWQTSSASIHHRHQYRTNIKTVPATASVPSVGISTSSHARICSTINTNPSTSTNASISARTSTRTSISIFISTRISTSISTSISIHANRCTGSTTTVKPLLICTLTRSRGLSRGAACGTA